jgi:hypothetical protein
MWAVVVLILAVWGLHGHGLTLGFWFDDHSHLELCQKNGFSDLVNGNRFDWNGRIAHAWWAKKETGWAYFRPLTVAVRTTLWQTFGLNPLPYHIVHLTLYSLSVVLLFGLLRRCGWGTITASIAGMFFVLHPANAFTTPWLANDGPVLVGLWLVSGLWLFHLSAQAGHRRPLMLAGVFLCYALAMLSRENGIVLGPLLVLFDWLRRNNQPVEVTTQPTWRWRFTIYVALAFEGVGYLFLRAKCLGESPVPRSPYVHWPSDPGFIEWWPYKVLNELVCLPLGLPFMPIVEVPWWQAHPLVTAFGVLVVAGLILLFLVPLRRSRVMWGLLVGIALAQAPTSLVFSAPYNYYLASVGWALLIATWAKHFWPTRPRLVAITTGTFAAWYLVGMWAGSWMLHSAATAERLVRADVMATNPKDYPAGTQIFFINMPFFAIEVAPSLRLAAERPDLEVYPLTFAPQLLFPMNEVNIEQEDERTFLVRLNGPMLFGDDFGDMVQLGWFGCSRSDLDIGQVAIAKEAGPMPFRVELVNADCTGVSSLRFIFDRPLDDPRYRFFLGMPDAVALEVKFGSDGSRAVTGRKNRIPTPIEERDFDRLRRAQHGVDHCVNLLSGRPE